MYMCLRAVNLMNIASAHVRMTVSTESPQLDLLCHLFVLANTIFIHAIQYYNNIFPITLV
jgi:hypothetical protein